MAYKVFAGLILLAMLAGGVSAFMNPYSAYCKRLGYEYVILQTQKGDAGYCVMPDGTRCDQLDFAIGTCGSKYNYCAVQGLPSRKVVGDPMPCLTLGGPECTLCQLKNGSWVESTYYSRMDTALGPVQDLNDIILTPITPTTTIPPTTTVEPERPSTTPTLPTVCGDGLCSYGESADNCLADCGPKGEKSDNTFVLLVAAVALLGVYAFFRLWKRSELERGGG